MSSKKKAADAADPDKIPLAKAMKRPAKPKSRKPRMSAGAARAEGEQRTKAAIAAADRENAKKRDERRASPDGLAASERAMAKSKKPDFTDRAIADADGPGPAKLSMLDAAAIVLRDGREWRSKAIVAEMAAKGLWTSPNGKTPEATLYAAMTKEIRRKPGARFRIAGRGLFAAADGGGR